MYLDKIISQATVLVKRYILPVTYDNKAGYLFLCYIVVLKKHNVFTAHFEEEPHIQEEANKLQRIFCLSFSFKLTDSVVTDKPSQPCSAKQTEVSGGQAGINAWSELIWKYFMIFLCTLWDHLMCVCVADYPWS